jgi:DNA-binding transcriptional LysR family regulator
MADLAGQRIWMPGLLPGSEWAAYYDDLAAAFGLTIERVGPHFGTEYLLDVLADSSTLANLAGERTRLLWPDHYDLRRIPIRHPTPVYPSSLIWHQDNPHPDLRTLLDYLALARVKRPESEIWIPSWAQS